MIKLLTYGLLDEELKYISEVENGLSCGCICAKCKQPLVAKNNPNNRKLPHFAHHSDKECEGAYETALHLLAKEILLKTKQLRLPDYHFDYDSANSKSLFKEGEVVTFDEIIKDGQRISVGDETIIPDSIGIMNYGQVFIEFANTHFVNEEKTQKIKNLGKACIEIDLSGQVLDEHTLTSFLISNTQNIYWVCNPRRDNYYKIERQKQKEIERKDEERRIKIERDYQNRVLKYQNNKELKILSINDSGEVNGCPKKIERLNSLKATPFYRHSILKSIIDGEFWNGKMYGHIPNGKWIYLKEEKVIIYPPPTRNVTGQDKKFADFFYRGLKIIQEIIENPEIGNCKFCPFYVDTVFIYKKEYEVCSHSMPNVSEVKH